MERLVREKVEAVCSLEMHPREPETVFREKVVVWYLER